MIIMESILRIVYPTICVVLIGFLNINVSLASAGGTSKELNRNHLVLHGSKGKNLPKVFDEKEEENREEIGSGDDVEDENSHFTRAVSGIYGPSNSTRSIADRPRGPILMEEKLENKYLSKFTPNAKGMNVKSKQSFIRSMR